MSTVTDSHRNQGRVHCDVCGIDFLRYGLKQHQRSKMHLRAVGELPPKPERPPPKPRGRPRIYDDIEPSLAKRNPGCYKDIIVHCDLCNLDIKYNYRATHRGTKQHIANEVAAALAAAKVADDN